MTADHWLKYNTRTNRFMLHKDSCSLVVLAKNYETYEETFFAYDLLYDGSWIGFASLEEVIKFHSENHAHREFKLCRKCYNLEARQLFKNKGNNNSPQYPL